MVLINWLIDRADLARSVLVLNIQKMAMFEVVTYLKGP